MLSHSCRRSSNPARNRVAGFTLIEVLVGCAVIGTLCGLLLPAVQQSREAARRVAAPTTCISSVLRLHNFHATFNRFPPDRETLSPGVSRRSRVSSRPPRAVDGSESRRLQIRADHLFDRRRRRLRRLRQPAGRKHDRSCLSLSKRRSRRKDPGSLYAGTNYVGNGGGGTLQSGSLTDSDGVFFKGSRIGLRT